MQFPDARLLIFAKLPQPGRVNTRLVPLLGEQGASEFHARCLRQAIAERCAARLAPVVVYITPDQSHPLLDELADRYSFELRPQCGCDLGERMLQAACDCLGEAGQVLLTGTDAPSLDVAQLRGALDALRTVDAVMVPAEDGGYVALGLTRAEPSLFDAIDAGKPLRNLR